MSVLRTFSICMFVGNDFYKYLNIHLIFYFQLASQKMVKIYWREYVSHYYDGEKGHKNQTRFTHFLGIHYCSL